MPKIIEGKLDATGLRVGLLVSRFNSFISDRLVEGAIDGLLRHGSEKEDICVVRVPGARVSRLATAGALVLSMRLDLESWVAFERGCSARGRARARPVWRLLCLRCQPPEPVRHSGDPSEPAGLGALPCEAQSVLPAGVRLGTAGQRLCPGRSG